MAAFTPVLPGSMPDSDDPGDLVIRATHEPPPPPGPNPRQAHISKDATSFRELFYALLRAHDAEIEALEEQVEKLRTKRSSETNQLKEISALPDADQKGALFEHVTGRQLLTYEAQPWGMRMSAPDGEKQRQKLKCMSDETRVEDGENFEDRDNKRASQQSVLTLAEQPANAVRQSTVRHSTLRASFVSISHNTFAALRLNERRWIKLVSDRYTLAQQHTNQLYEKWIVSDDDITRIRLHNDNVDLWPTVVSKRMKVRRAQKTRLSAIEGTIENGLLKAVQSFQGGLMRHEVNSRRSYIRQYGFLAYLEKYHVALPHSGSHLSWLALGMLLISYDAIVVPLQPFDLDESRGVLGFMKWFQAVYWTCDIFLTFFTAIYIDVDLVRNLRVIAYKYASSWLLFDLGILLPVWFEQLSLGEGGLADVKTLKAIRLIRFFRLVRLAKFTSLWDTQLKAINNPSVLLLFKLLRLVLGLIIFTHVNGCLWYGVGKQHEGWTIHLGDTDDLYKYLTSVHWTITQFSGTSEMAPGKFSAERAYAVSTVFMSILIFAIFLSNFTNIIMQLQALTVEKDHQLRDLCIYMRGHQIPRHLSMRVRNYLNWKAHTDHSRACDALNILPDRLKMEIEFEVWSPTLAQHEFFRVFIEVYPRLCRRAFHDGLFPIYMSPEDLVFSAQETNDFVWFTVSGMLDYAVILRRANEALTLDRETVTAGTTLSEPTLWMQWQHRGTLMSLTYCDLLSLNAEHFGTMVLTHPPAHASCNLYARRLIKAMDKDYWRCTDVIIPARIIRDDSEDFLDNILEFNFRLLNTGAKSKSAASLKVPLEADEDLQSVVRGSCTGKSNISEPVTF